VMTDAPEVIGDQLGQFRFVVDGENMGGMHAGERSRGMSRPRGFAVTIG
jgi:hypothetical protein